MVVNINIIIIGMGEWPIINRLKLFGPFKILESGTLLVDLPGFNGI